MIYLHKILPLVVLPVGISILLVLAGIRFSRRALIWTGVALLWISSTPLVSRIAMRSAEGWAERGLADAAPTTDAIIVLSEGRLIAPGKASISEWGDADRFFAGVALFKAKKATLLVFTGGAVPWEPGAALEGDVLVEYAKEMGVPDGQVITTPRVRSTAEEAQAVATLLHKRFLGRTGHRGSTRVLLVTSAFHMLRAQALFKRVGISSVAFPVDFRVSGSQSSSILDILPSGSALAQTETALREWYGRLFYLVMSWIPLTEPF